MATTKEYTVLVIGKAGSGKSTICNQLVGTRAFPVHRSMDQAVTSAKLVEKIVSKDNQQIKLKIIDTPDLYSQAHSRSVHNREFGIIKTLVGSWSPSMVLMTVRSDQRFTKEDFELYRAMKGSFVTGNNLVVAFSHGEDLHRDVTDVVRSAGPQLQEIFKDAKQKHMIFCHQDDTSYRSYDGEGQIDSLLGHLRKIDEESGTDWRSILIGGAVLVGMILFRR